MCFSRDRPRWRVSDLSEYLNLHPSTVSRILKTFRKFNFVKKDPVTGEFELGCKILDLGQAILSQMDIVKIALPFMTEMTSEYNESTFLVTLDDVDSITIAQVAAPRLMSPSGYHLGRRYQASAVSGGKILLAHSPEDVVETLLKHGLKRYTPNTITSPEKLREVLDQALKLDYAFADQETEIGLFAIAAPIRNFEGKVVAAVNVSGPPQRLGGKNLPRFIEGIRDTAAKISTALGWSPQDSSPSIRSSLLEIERFIG